MEFWQKKLKRNKEDVLQTARDVYNLPVEFEIRLPQSHWL